MTFAVEPAPTPTLPVRGTDAAFPVHRIFCVGRNYAAHAAEMGAEVDREAPFYFLKSAHHLQLAQGDVPMAPRTENYHHEVELVVALGRGGRNIPQGQAFDHVFGYGVGLDMTRRDVQATAKAKGRPWDTAKDVEASALSTPLEPAANVANPARGRIALKVNGSVRQEGDLSEHVWTIEEIIADLSTLYTLRAGDLIFMGTPSGVGPVQVGDVLMGSADGIADFTLTMAPPLG